jgi:hypothetical protein
VTAKDLKALKDFMLWLRRERIAYSSLSAGGVTLDGVVDMKIEIPADMAQPEARQTMFERYGAELLKAPAAKPSEGVPDEALLDA